MKGGQQPRGFTIIEAMIFLAVTGVLLLTATLLISGKQNQTAFDQGMRQITNSLQQTVNQVATGYYNSDGGFSCSENTSTNTIAFTSTSSSQGTNTGCILIGEAVQFAPLDNGTIRYDQYVVFPLAGAQYYYASPSASPVPNTELSGVDSTPLSPGYSGGADETQTVNMPNGIKLNAINGSSAPGVALIAFTTLDLGTNVTHQQTSTVSGTNNVNMVEISGTSFGMRPYSGAGTAEAALKDICPAVGAGNCTVYNTPLQLCFNSFVANQAALITIGTPGNPSAVVLTYQDSSC